MQIGILYVTHKNREEAEKVSNHLLSKRLIACSNSFPIQSSYWWKGNFESGDEIVTLLKTTEDNIPNVESEILKIHPYETPCIINMTMKVNESYGLWVQGEIRPIN